LNGFDDERLRPWSGVFLNTSIFEEALDLHARLPAND
jgi:hypothetical protein